ncbi:RNA_pol_Rpb2_3 domain-containing protein [Gammaproteobacteria bacterium]
MLSRPEKISKLKMWLNGTILDSNVVKRNLGIDASHITPQVLLSSTEKLIKINKREVEPDDRDDLKFSKFLGLEDYVDEHISKDAGRLQQKAAYKMQMKKNLSWLHPGFFSPQIRSIVIGNTLANNVDGINPLEHWDNSHRVTKLGEGGIGSIEAIPASSRQIAQSSFGFLDPVHVMESEKIGVTSFVNNNVAKGRDGKLYKVMKDKDGKLSWMDHEAILDKQVKIPEN